MKRIVRYIAMLFVFCCVFALAACTDEPTKYTVTLKSEVSPYQIDGKITGHDYLDYDGVWGTVEVEQGGIVGNIEVNVQNAEKIGYRFCGWFTDQSYTVQWNLMLDTVKGDITLYAKWERI